MTPEQHIAKLKERGFGSLTHRFWAELYHMVKEAVAEEREACSMLVDEMGDDGHDYRSIMYAIRARSTK